MTNSKLLLDVIKKEKMEITRLANIAGISRQALYKKINAKREFKGSEINNISKALNLSINEREQIFFDESVDK